MRFNPRDQHPLMMQALLTSDVSSKMTTLVAMALHELNLKFHGRHVVTVHVVCSRTHSPAGISAVVMRQDRAN